MAYNNSRRNTRSTAPPSPQVTYHQNSGRPGIPNQQQFQTNKPVYQQQQPLQSQQQPLPPQQQPQQQQIQQTMQQQQVQQASAVYKNPAVQTPTKPHQPPLPTAPQPPTLTPKLEVTTPMKAPHVQEKSAPPSETPSQAVDNDMETEAGEGKKWQKRPKPQGYKVNKVQKRRRKNARFRKLLTPKNAIMVLNELQPGVAFDSREVMNAFNQTTYIVSFEVDGQQFSGEGTSKGAAKQAAAEAAVKSLILKKIADSKMREDAEPMDTAENTEESQSEGGENTTNGGRRRELPEDEVPWGSLASFALFRLFNEWENQGTYVPFPAAIIPKPKVPMATINPTPTNTSPKPPKKPANPASLQGTHPVTLVGRLWPGSVFSELSRDGQPPNMTFVMGVTVDGKPFSGTAKNKKDAKKECAKAALAGMGVQWEELAAQTA